MWSAISTTTTVDLSGDWFRADLRVSAALAGVMVGALFILQVIKGALRRDPHALGRALTGCGIAFLGATAAIIVTDLLLALTDALSNGVVHLAGQRDLASMGKLLTPVGVLTAGGFTPALVIALSVFFVIASVLVWAVFIIRKALIIVAAVFAPIAFGGAPADATRGWVRKWIEFTLAMVFSKLVVVLIFTIALSLMSHSGGGWTGLSNLLTGLLLLILASFSPWMVFKLVHFIGGDLAAAHHSSVASDTRAAAGSMTAMGARAKGSAQKLFAGRSGAASGAGAAAAGGPTPVGAAVAAGGAAAARGDRPRSRVVHGGRRRPYLGIQADRAGEPAIRVPSRTRQQPRAALSSATGWIGVRRHDRYPARGTHGAVRAAAGERLPVRPVRAAGYRARGCGHHSWCPRCSSAAGPGRRLPHHWLRCSGRGGVRSGRRADSGRMDPDRRPLGAAAGARSGRLRRPALASTPGRQRSRCPATPPRCACTWMRSPARRWCMTRIGRP